MTRKRFAVQTLFLGNVSSRPETPVAGVTIKNINRIPANRTGWGQWFGRVFLVAYSSTLMVGCDSNTTSSDATNSDAKPTVAPADRADSATQPVIAQADREDSGRKKPGDESDPQSAGLVKGESLAPETELQTSEKTPRQPAAEAEKGLLPKSDGLLNREEEASDATEPLLPEETAMADPYGAKNPWEVKAAGAFAAPDFGTRLLPDANLWVDPERKRVIVDGYVTLDAGPLEMFACPVGTKEHESIVAVMSPAKGVHAALLAVGAVQGTPVSFVPEYRPATGQRIAIWVLWKDAEGKVQKTRAQEWIQVTGEERILESDWVFAGSSFWTDPESGEQYYQADSGDLVCVSNFSTAMLDLPIESSRSDASLVYQAFSEKIPPRGTPVRMVFLPISLPNEDGPADGNGDSEDPALVPPEDALVASPAE